MIPKPKDETRYLVYLDWPEGPGGASSHDRLAEAIEEARKLSDKWANRCCEVRLLKRSKKFINFKEKQ
jgi:hypothetical protein